MIVFFGTWALGALLLHAAYALADWRLRRLRRVRARRSSMRAPLSFGPRLAEPDAPTAAFRGAA